MRVGVVAKKVGMSRLYLKETGGFTPVTLLEMEECHIIDKRSKETHGYDAVVLAYGNKKTHKVKKPQRVAFEKKGLHVRNRIVEFRVSQSALLDVGGHVGFDHFVKGQYVDIIGTSIGKGFSGAMKRHNFRGLEATHGVSVSHRSHGSTGQRQDPGKVFKGKKMAGHLGDVQVKMQNLQVLYTDPSKRIVAVKGSVPGNKGQYISISDAVKRALPSEAPYPASVSEVL